MVHFVEIDQAPSPYSMLQHIGRVETPKHVARNSKILPNNIDNKGRGICLSIYMRYCRNTQKTSRKMFLLFNHHKKLLVKYSNKH